MYVCMFAMFILYQRVLSSSITRVVIFSWSFLSSYECRFQKLKLQLSFMTIRLAMARYFPTDIFC